MPLSQRVSSASFHPRESFVFQSTGLTIYWRNFYCELYGNFIMTSIVMRSFECIVDNPDDDLKKLLQLTERHGLVRTASRGCSGRPFRSGVRMLWQKEAWGHTVARQVVMRCSR